MHKFSMNEIQRLNKFAEKYGEVTNNFDKIFASKVTNPKVILNQMESKGCSKILYCDIDGEECTIEDKNLNYKLVGLGIKDRGDELFLSYFRNGSLAHPESRDAWNGCFVGTYKELHEKFLKYAMGNSNYDKLSVPNITINEPSTSIFEQSVQNKAKTVKTETKEPDFEYVDTDYSPTVIPKRWSSLVDYIENHSNEEYGGFDNLSQLLNYLAIIEIRTITLFNEDKSKFITSKDDKYILCNSGTRTKLFNKPILFVAEYNDKFNKFTSAEPVSNRATLGELGFIEKDFNATPERVSFFDRTESVIYRYSKADVDLENEFSVMHCLKDRIDRLPEKFRVASLENRLTYYMNDMDKAFERHQIDPFYFKPFYNIELKRLQFIIPVYKNDNPREELEYGYALANKDGYWRVYTVFTAEMVRNLIKPLSPYTHY